ncbi:hypothetical protein [Acidianus bottle-shaped virus]|uniref:Uncharacterized protein ORF247 n=1 Tax=Acidianus bottle-shaped virus (isolate Italy/Pozzuoli) TaxID=654911 RepID=Y247_ABVP|nr:hypothetical protein ABV_gp08 [Acidianus bottle-shaped virus]A4ZU94.1 RecName: Full=Uncharacterized protein ORF247 [Acidianus bottle-shaped virus (isolate Pozzuoli)]ABP73398.1 hypothetical protein [Acidianus bottle-shaped virus]
MGYLKELIKRVPELPVCDVISYVYYGIVPYDLRIKNFYFRDYLRSLTGIYINKYQYTTFAQKITGGNHPKITYKGVTIGYDNVEHYVHVPDLIASLILINYSINAYVGGSKVLFWADSMRSASIFYSLADRVRTPFYTWEKNPEFSDNLETILYLIGYSDVIKRNGGVKVTPAEIERNKKFKTYYFLPTFYTAYYLRNKHTFIESPNVILKVYKEIEPELKVPDIPFSKLVKKANELIKDNAEALFD